jgi:phosphoribosylanthranilate isomerase
MLTQIYEVTSAQEAAAISEMGVDHIGVLIGDGSFPREQSVTSAVEIAASIRRPSKLCALFLSSDLAYVVRAIRELAPAIVHLGAAAELVTPEHVLDLRRGVPGILVMRSVPVVGLESIDLARRYEGIADFLLLGQLPARRQANRRARRHP